MRRGYFNSKVIVEEWNHQKKLATDPVYRDLVVAEIEQANDRKRTLRKFILYPCLVLLFGLWIYVTYFAKSA